MDTDDLSKEAYEGILIEAEKLSHDLTLHYGLLSYDCNDESEYLDKAEKLTKKFLKVDAGRLEDLFWGNALPKDKLDGTLNSILSNIEKIRKIPEEERHYDDYN
jgi:hypothetical protein